MECFIYVCIYNIISYLNQDFKTKKKQHTKKEWRDNPQVLIVAQHSTQKSALHYEKFKSFNIFTTYNSRHLPSFGLCSDQKILIWSHSFLCDIFVLIRGTKKKGNELKCKFVWFTIRSITLDMFQILAHN